MLQWIISSKLNFFLPVCVMLLGYYTVYCDIRKEENINLKNHLTLEEKKDIDKIRSGDISFSSINKETKKYPSLTNVDEIGAITHKIKFKENIKNRKINFDSIDAKDKKNAAPGDQENDSNANKYDSSIILSLKSSACQREGESFASKSSDVKSSKFVSGNKIIKQERSLQNNGDGKILNDELIISDNLVDYEMLEENEYYNNIHSHYNEHHLPDCTEKVKRDPLLIVSTIDGYISGINYITGRVIWSRATSTQNEPLLSSSMSKLEVRSRGEWVRLIPSTNGGIYRFDGENVETLPVTADTFLHSSFKFNDDTIFSGGKFSEVLGIHPHTGEIKYVCDKMGCPVQMTSKTNRNTLVIRRISYSVRAISPSEGNERWNFSVGEHEVNLASSGCESLLKNSELDPIPSLHFVLPEGKIIALNEKSQILWQQKLPSPILSAWSLKDEDLEEINLFSSNSIPALLPERGSEDDLDSKREPMLYVGVHQGQLYVQENKNMKNRNSGAQHYINSMSEGFPKVQWKPYLATAVSRTPVIHHGASNHPLLLDYDTKQQINDLVVKHTYEYPFDNGYYLYGDDFELLLNESDYWTINKEEESPVFSPETLGGKLYHYLFSYGVPLTKWSVVCIPVICFVISVLYIRHWIRTERANTQIMINRIVFSTVAFILNNVLRENQRMGQLIQRLGLHIPPLPAPPPPPPNALSAESGNEPLITPSTSHSEVLTQRQDSCFISRFSSDFEPISPLGQGGFGVVLRVKKKLDENEYAVKRIVLPSKESSAERVKREVKALAKLNHPNIVRYYNSWLESPPPNSEQEEDKVWKASYTREEFTEEHQITSKDKQSSVLSIQSESKKVEFTNSNKFDVIGNIHNRIYQDNNSVNIVFEEQNDSEDNLEENYNDSEDDGEVDHSDSEVQSIEEFSWSKSKEILQKYKTKERTQSDSIVFMASSNEGEAINSQSGRYLSDPIHINTSEQRNSSYSRSHLKKQKRPSSLDISDFNSGIFKNTDNIRKIHENNPPLICPRTYLYIQMELCKEESLKEWLTANKDRDQNWIFSVFNDIVHAVEYVHDRALMHRDLKPSNIFFSLDGEIKIGDFGLVTNIDEDENLAITPLDESVKSKNARKQKTLNVGTQLYMSPEQLSGQSYTYKVDIYSLGLIFFEMLVSFSTEMERHDVMRKAREKQFPPDFVSKFPDVADLLRLALHRDPNERPTTKGIRIREPLKAFQKPTENISPHELFHLIRPKGHVRKNSGSQIILQ